MSVSAPRQDATQVMRRRGALILPIFALVWAAAGISGLASSTAVTISGLVAVVVTAIAVALALRDRGTSNMTRPLNMPDDWYRRLTLVNVLQAVGIGLAIAGLIWSGWPLLIPAVVCLIVGVHFFPLARIFNHAPYGGTGAALCAVAVAGVITFAAVDGQTSRAVVGLGAAIVLWATSLHLSYWA